MQPLPHDVSSTSCTHALQALVPLGADADVRELTPAITAHLMRNGPGAARSDVAEEWEKQP